jgi:hypothetical protein
MPDQMMLQIHESIGHPLELDRILGDERNYAGTSFVKASDFGQPAIRLEAAQRDLRPDIPNNSPATAMTTTAPPPASNS